MVWRTVALLFIGLLAAGCAVSVVDLRDTLDLNQATFRDKLDSRAGLADEFLACTTRAYDERVAFQPTDRSRMTMPGATDLCERSTRLSHE